MPCDELTGVELVRETARVVLRMEHVKQRLDDLVTVIGSRERQRLMAEREQLWKLQLHSLDEVRTRGLRDKLVQALGEARARRSWAQQLSVTGGQVHFERLGEEHTYRYTVRGVLECGDHFLIGFLPSDYFNLDVKEPGDFHVTGGHIDLRRGKPKLEASSPRPDSFLDLCKTLLAPLPEQERHGYIFLALLELDGRTLDKIYFKQTDHPDSFVEFAHLLDEPFVLVTHSNRYSFGSATELKRQFEKRWWPLERK